MILIDRMLPVTIRGHGHLRVVLWIDQLPHLVLVAPDRIGIPSDELVDIHSLDHQKLRTPDPLLLAIDEYGHGLFLAPSFLGSLLGGDFPLPLAHRNLTLFRSCDAPEELSGIQLISAEDCY